MNVLKADSFFDLCVSEACFSQGNIEETLKLLYNYGYRTIAINYLIEDGNIDFKRRKPKRNSSLDLVPLPHITEKVKDSVSKLKLENFEILNRLTIVFSNKDLLYHINRTPNYKKFDIIAVLPTSMQAFMFTCSTFEADIFAIDPVSKFNLRLNRNLYHQLINRGYHFELLYSPAIEDSTKRKNLIHVSHLFHSFGKSKNIIFSSGAQSCLHIRGPYDVISLGLIFGLNELQCKNALIRYPRNTVINSVGRKHGKSIMFIENIENKEDEDKNSVTIEDSDGEDLALNQPAQKKSKV